MREPILAENEEPISYVNRQFMKSSLPVEGVVIVSDAGETIFKRCLVEEILQGLGPLADKGRADFSIFNTKSQYRTFTRHDQVIMNCLYDKRIKPGMSKAEVAKVMPNVVKHWVAHLR